MGSFGSSNKFAKLGLLLIATLLAVGLGEGLVRLLGMAPAMKALELAAEDCVYQRSRNPVLGFELKANYRNDSPDFIASYERTNAHGFRDRERSLKKPEGVRRVVLLGDSVVEGHGLPETATISRQWEAWAKHGTLEVLNFGVSAYCTLAEIELFEQKGLVFEPDVVVVLFVENDFDNFNREAFALDRAEGRSGLVDWGFRQSHLFRTAAVRFNFFQMEAVSDPVRWNLEAIGDNNVVAGFRRLRALADREDFQPLIVLWPQFRDDAIVTVPTMSASDATPVAERLATMHGLPCARLASAFQKHRTSSHKDVNPRTSYTLGDGLHPSAEGVAVAARGLHELLAAFDAGEWTRPESDGDTDTVIQRAKALGADQPNYARVHHRVGVRHLKNGDYPQAIEAFQRALNEDHAHAGALGNMGLAYERRGDLEKAKELYQRAIAAQEDFVQGHYHLARMALVENRVVDAVAALRRVLAFDPKHTDARNLLGMELGKVGQLREARTHLERAVMLEPDFSEAHNNLATVYAALGMLEKAVAHFEEAVRADPGNVGAASRLEHVKRLLREPQDQPRR